MTTIRYKEVVETVLRFKDSKEKLIRRAVIGLLPRLAAFSPERFASEYLPKSIAHLISVLKHQPERYAKRARGWVNHNCIWTTHVEWILFRNAPPPMRH